MTRVSFGAFVLDQETRELRRGHVPVALSPKAFELLGVLVANRPRALSKGDLQDRLWPNTFVVEKNLSNLIGEIRAAIGDDRHRPRFIRTVPRFGYAFRDSPPTGPDGISMFVKWAHGRVDLDDGDYVLGRDPSAEIYLSAAGVSRRHALIKVSMGTATIEDLGSKNGTFLGDLPVTEPKSLSDGEIIGVGSEKLTFKVVHAPESTKTEAAGVRR